MAGTTSYKNKWLQDNMDRISFVVPKGYKEKIKQAAMAENESMNGFIKKVLDEKLGIQEEPETAAE